MARSITSETLRARTNRLKLARGSRHFVQIQRGLAIAYRRAEKTGAGSWQARIWNGDKYEYKNLGTADDHADADGGKVLTFLQAQDKARVLFPLVADPNRPRRDWTVGEASERYLDWFRTERKSVLETQNVIAAHILPTFRDQKIEELATPTIRDWHRKLATKPARKRSRPGDAPSFKEKPQTEDAKRSRKATANRILTVFKAILNKAYEDELVSSKDAWSRVKPFKNADEPITRYLSEAEAIRLIEACPHDLRRLVRGALFTGSRHSEIASLLLGNVNLKTRTIFFTPSKSGKGRHVPLNDDGFAFFRSLIGERKADDFVFVKARGEPWGKNHHVRPLSQACKRAGIHPPISFHELRHTYASLLAQAGADLLTISKLLGHADTRITARHYAHLCDRTLSNAVNALLPGFGARDDTIASTKGHSV